MEGGDFAGSRCLYIEKDRFERAVQLQGLMNIEFLLKKSYSKKQEKIFGTQKLYNARSELG
jgi:hypothetical protein